jgi:serine/threonine-protein kinase RsbW
MDFRRENFDEAELKNLVETALNYKAQHIDNDKKVLEMHERIEFEFPSALSLMHAVLDYLVGRMARMGVVNPDKSNIYIALDEAFVNAVKHGNRFDAEKSVKISADITPEEARFIVEDEGAGFDVKAIPDPLDPENLFKTSGRGFLMIHNIMDEVFYNEKGNRLEMLKKTEKH